MDKKLNKAFEQAIIRLKLSEITPSKEINKDVFASRKYAQIVSSVREIGLIEAPIVTFSDDGYTLLDGHLRLNALKDLDIQQTCQSALQCPGTENDRKSHQSRCFH